MERNSFEIKKQIRLFYSGIFGDFTIEPNMNSSIIQIASFFNINLNVVQSLSIQNSNKIISNFDYQNIVTGQQYDLIPNFVQNEPQPPPAPQTTIENGNNMQDVDYFNGYTNLTIHRTMLLDKARTTSYKNAIEKCSDFIKDKIALDVGTGTGILSIFTVKAGAKHVYAVDASKIIKDAEQIVSANNLSDKITLIEGKIEEIQLPCQKVDVIISEWMGSMLLFESMFLSVINARDRYLKEDGIMLPAHCQIKICPVDLTDYIAGRLGCWSDMYGVDMSVLKFKAMAEFFAMPVFARAVKPSELIADEYSFFNFDMKFVREKDLENILSTFKFEIKENSTIHGFAVWFDVHFINEVLSTSPLKPETHWKQTLFVFDDFPKVEKGQIVKGIISIKRNSVWGRHYEVTVKYWLKDENNYRQKHFPLSNQ